MRGRHCFICTLCNAVDMVQGFVFPCCKDHVLMEFWEHSPEVAVIKVPSNDKHSIWMSGLVFADDAML